MSRKIALPTLLASFFVLSLEPLEGQWTPPSQLSRQKIVQDSQNVLAMPDIPLKAQENIFRIRVLEMDWDIGGMVYEPEDASKIPVGPDGKKVGVFVLHGGGGDHRSKDDLARLISGKFGFKVTTMSYPGSLYLLNSSHDWPGEPVRTDLRNSRAKGQGSRRGPCPPAPICHRLRTASALFC